MKPERKGAAFRSLLAVLCALVLVPGDTLAQAAQQTAQQPTAPAPSQGNQTTKLSPDQLDSLVAPIALYPDPLLAQVLAASTYPLEIVLLQRWLEKNKNLKDKQLADAVAKQPWDPSVQALAGLPDVVKRLSDEIQWTTDLGNAFLAQQGEVMEAVQRMRAKAKDKGTLTTTKEQKVETKVVENKSVIVIEQANPQVVYVPSYSPTVVYGAAPVYYPYPPTPSWGYYAAGAAISFGFGVAMGAMWSGGWGYGCGWGGNNVQINNYNNFNRSANINRSANVSNRANQVSNRSNWQHNAQHRGGTPYGDRATADRFGGSARGDSLSQRQSSARGRQGSDLSSNRGAGGGLGERGGGAGVGGGSRGTGVANRAGESGFGGGGRTGGADSIGGRDVSRSGGGNRDAFGGGSRGGSGGFDGASARSSSARGSSSLSSSRGGGGGSRGGGGGFSRGGGGRRR